ncbi:MAG: hypothetical protein K0M69_05345 [Youngiibacter sp.]|nr:hypothetical protein [Youngiibacter sp.]
MNPALTLIHMVIDPKSIAGAIAAEMKFRAESDRESLELVKFVKENGVREALLKYSSLDPDSKLIDLVEEAYNA